MKQKKNKQITIIFFLSFIITMKLCAHKEPTHQYIVVEAYKILKAQVGTITELEQNVGTTEGRCNCQFQSPFVVGGAWSEDQQDPVYNLYTSGIPVPILDYIGNDYVSQLGSVSHFWESDGSNAATDNTTLALSNTIFSRFGHLGPYPNAYKKALAYQNGGFIFTDYLDVANTQLAYSTYYVRYKYDGLINLYKTGRIYCYGLWDEIGRQILPASWVTLKDSDRKRLVYNILGRMAHLLADMSVPVHTHNDEHGIWEDRYEKKMNVEGDDPSFPKTWGASNISSGFIDPYQCSDHIYGLMYGVNQIADQFATNRYDGDRSYTLDGYIGTPEWKTIVDNTVCNSSSANYSDADLSTIRDVTFPYVIRATAGLFYWFVTQTGLLQVQIPIIINKNFEFDPSESQTEYRYLAQPTTISVPANYAKNGRQYVFAGWSDRDNSNPRSLTPLYNLTFTALYKMHLQSNNSTVTAAYTQTRLATSFSGVSAYTQCMIYESAGEIWSSVRYKSGGVLGPWLTEKRASSGNGGNTNPSIVNVNSVTFYAVWERWANDEQEIYVARNYWGNWESPKKITNFPKPGLEYLPSRPVIAVYKNETRNRLHVYYQRGFSIYSKTSTDEGQTWSDGLSTLQNGFYPTVEGSGNSELNLVAVANSARLYLFINNYPYDYAGGWNTIELIPGSNWIDYSGEGDLTEFQPGSPQIRTCSSYYRKYIFWQQYLYSNYEHYYYIVQSRNPQGIWSSATAYESANSYAELSGPSLAMTESFQKSFMVWSENNQIKQVNGDMLNGSWNGTITNLASGKYPYFEHGIPILGNTATYIFGQSGSPLTTINSNLIETCSSNPEVIAVESVSEARDYARALYAIDTVNHKTFTIRMTQPKIGKSHLSFVPVNDTLPNIHAKNFFDYLKTEPYNGTSENDSLEFTISVYSKGFENSTFSFPLSLNFELENGKSGNLLSLNHELKEKFKSFAVKKVVKKVRNKQLWLNPIGNLPEEKLGPNWIFGVAHIYQNSNKGAKFAKEYIEGSIVGAPNQYAVSNYPNPFNPATTINYQIPKEGMVTLKIYDMLGREVMTLVDEYKTAGYYTATFNASTSASGMYFYKFMSLPFDGGRKDMFTSVKKMLLLK